MTGRSPWAPATPVMSPALVDVASGKQTVLAGLNPSCYSVDAPRPAFSGDGNFVAWSTFCGSVVVWNTKTAARVATFDDKAEVSALALDPTGSRLAVASWNGSLTVVDLKTMKAALHLVSRHASGHRCRVQLQRTVDRHGEPGRYGARVRRAHRPAACASTSIPSARSQVVFRPRKRERLPPPMRRASSGSGARAPPAATRRRSSICCRAMRRGAAPDAARSVGNVRERLSRVARDERRLPSACGCGIWIFRMLRFLRVPALVVPVLVVAVVGLGACSSSGSSKAAATTSSLDVDLGRTHDDPSVLSGGITTAKGIQALPGVHDLSRGSLPEVGAGFERIGKSRLQLPAAVRNGPKFLAAFLGLPPRPHEVRRRHGDNLTPSG